MSHFGVFEVPLTIERELIDFYFSAPAFQLSELQEHRLELSQHYGVYFLYYQGDFDLYRDLAEYNRQEATKPIYVGKAVTEGGRKGKTGLTGNHLYKRLWYP